MMFVFAECVKQMMAAGLWFESHIYEQFEIRYSHCSEISPHIFCKILFIGSGPRSYPN
jgi:hypothetical protein